MSKYVKKLLPLSLYNPQEIEHYLRHMASNGLYLKKFKGGIAYFEKNMPQSAEYHLEPIGQNETSPSPDTIKYYNNCGWSYICSIKHLFNIYMSTADEPSKEYFNYPEEVKAYKNLYKKIRHSAVLTAIFICIGIIIIISALIFQETPFLNFIKYEVNMIIVFQVLVGIFVMHQSIRDSIGIKKLIKILEKGSSIKDKSRSVLNNTVFVSMIVLSGGMVISVIYGMFVNWDINIAEYNKNLPTIDLNELENNQHLKISSKNTYDGHDYDNHIYYDWSYLSPVQYEITQHGIIRNAIWKDKSGIYNPSIKTEYYEILFPFLSKPMLTDMINKELKFYKFEPILIEEQQDTKFDSAVYIRIHENQMLFAALGRKVIFIKYHGYGHLKDDLDKVAEAVKKFK